MKYFNILGSLLVCVAFLCALSADAALYFRDKEVLRDGKMVADMERLYWASAPDSADTDRIQGHLDISIDGREVAEIKLVFQMFDTKGKLISSFSITPKTCSLHPCGYSDYAYCHMTFPFCGVENSHMKFLKSDRSSRWYENWKKEECYKKGHIAWFYVDFPRDRNAQSVRLVNVVIDGKEVQYTVRFAGNRLLRSLTKPPEIKHGTEAGLGDESSCEEWLPQRSDGMASPSGGAGDGESPVSRSQWKDKSGASQRVGGVSHVADDDNSPAEDSEISDDGVPFAAVPVVPLRLDVSPLVALRSGFTGKAYKCKALLDEFAAAVGQANGNAEEKRMKLDRAVSGNLEKMLAKAQSAGQLDLALSITTAISEFPEKTDAGDSPEIAKVFDARQARQAQIDRELAQDVLAAVKTFNVALAEQKSEWTKKGELDVAKTIADFQRALSAWTKDSLAVITAPRGKSH